MHYTKLHTFINFLYRQSKCSYIRNEMLIDLLVFCIIFFVFIWTTTNMLSTFFPLRSSQSALSLFCAFKYFMNYFRCINQIVWSFLTSNSQDYTNQLYTQPKCLYLKNKNAYLDTNYMVVICLVLYNLFLFYLSTILCCQSFSPLSGSFLGYSYCYFLKIY